MPKLSPKDWLRLLAIYGVGILFLCSLPFLFQNLKRGILAIPGLESFYKNSLRQFAEWITPWIPQNITLYFWILLGLGVLYFLAEDLLKLLRGKRDAIQDKELSLDEQIVNSVAREYGEKEPLPLNLHSQIRYFPIVHYWIIGILLFGLLAAWIMSFIYPKDMTGLSTISLTLGGISFYLLFLARSATRQIRFDSDHVYLGKNEKNLFCEKDYDCIYFMHFLVQNLWSVEKRYSLLVFRKGFCFPPFHYFIDRFFPASNAQRQVIFFNVWKDESGEIVNDASLMKRILIHCDQHKIRVKQWTCEAQFFLTSILLALAFIAWILWR